tara:strand:- start:2107 stop:2571 length:465 start_codon:yes stop_codon:yes gene_type:complete
MSDSFLSIYNNLVKLTRNKKLYFSIEQDNFYGRMIIFFFHLSILLKVYKNKEKKKILQDLFDYCIRQIELSIREMGYGDATINKKMKDYVNLLFSIIDKIDNWDSKSYDEKKAVIKLFININNNYDYFIDYFEKYSLFLSKNPFNKLTKDIISF